MVLNRKPGLKSKMKSNQKGLNNKQKIKIISNGNIKRSKRSRTNKSGKRFRSYVDRNGAVCIKNLPRGFYEYSLHKFFSQFGTIKRYKVARSNKTGNPMGFAYIEFEHSKVAKIVAKTMDNYLMFDKIIKCRFIDANNIKEKMFANSNLEPEFCKGTKRKLHNQFKMENVCDETLKEKLKKRLNMSLKKLSKTLGIKVEQDLSLMDSSSLGQKNETVSVENDSLMKQVGEEKTSVVCDLQNSEANTPKSLKKKKISKKNLEGNVEHCKKQVSTMKGLSENAKGKSSQTLKGKRKRPISSNVESPLVMVIDEIDEEIYLKTPPNVIKVIKRGEQKVICDGVASTVRKSLKKVRLETLKPVALKLFDKAEDPSSVKKRRKRGKKANANKSEASTDSKMKSQHPESSVKHKVGSKKVKLLDQSKRIKQRSRDSLEGSRTNKKRNERKPLMKITSEANPSNKKNKAKKKKTNDFSSSLTNERCINISERAAPKLLTSKKRKSK